MFTPEHLEKLRKYNEEASHFRGTVLNEMANLELYINLYIAAHFCPHNFDRVHEMQLLILGDSRTTLGGKIEIFHNIAKIHDKKWVGEYKGDRTLVKDLTYAMEQRNIFAHRIIDLDSFTTERPEKTVRFITFKNSLDKIDYDEDKFNNLLILIYNICNYFHQRYELIKSTFPPRTKSVCTPLNRHRGIKHHKYDN